jgi:hypothetical protein
MFGFTSLHTVVTRSFTGSLNFHAGCVSPQVNDTGTTCQLDFGATMVLAGLTLDLCAILIEEPACVTVYHTRCDEAWVKYVFTASEQPVMRLSGPQELLGHSENVSVVFLYKQRDCPVIDEIPVSGPIPIAARLNVTEALVTEALDMNNIELVRWLLLKSRHPIISSTCRFSVGSDWSSTLQLKASTEYLDPYCTQHDRNLAGVTRARGSAWLLVM